MEYAAGFLGGISAFATIQLVGVWLKRNSLRVNDRAEELPAENGIIEKKEESFSVFEKLFYVIISGVFVWMIAMLYRGNARLMFLSLLIYEILLIGAMVDQKTRCIYNWVPAALIVTGICNLLYLFFFQQTAFLSACLGSLAGAVIIFLVLYIMARIFQAGIGMGDVKLIASLGFMFGLGGTLEIITLALLICMVTAVTLMIFKKKNKKDTLPFGPFVLMGYAGLVLINFILMK